MPVQERGEPKTIDQRGLICPKDPNRDSTDPEHPATHLSCEILEVTVVDPKKPNTRKAVLKCNTCDHQWTVNPYPPRDPRARGDRVDKK